MTGSTFDENTESFCIIHAQIRAEKEPIFKNETVAFSIQCTGIGGCTDALEQTSHTTHALVKKRQKCVRTYTHTRTHADTHTHTHTNTNMHKQARFHHCNCGTPINQFSIQLPVNPHLQPITRADLPTRADLTLLPVTCRPMAGIGSQQHLQQLVLTPLRIDLLFCAKNGKQGAGAIQN